jgi:hypothetical protein
VTLNKTAALAAAVALSAGTAQAQTVTVADTATYTDASNTSLTGPLDFSFSMNLDEVGTPSYGTDYFAFTSASVTIGGQTYQADLQNSDLVQTQYIDLVYIDNGDINFWAILDLPNNGTNSNLGVLLDPTTLTFDTGTITVSSDVVLDGGACQGECNIALSSDGGSDGGSVPEPPTAPVMAAGLAALPFIRRFGRG